MELEEAQRSAATLAEAIETFPSGDYVLDSVTVRFLMGTHHPVVLYRRGEERLSFIVTAKDPAQRVYKRTKRYDVTYFSEDVPDEEQSRIYQRDRVQIDRFLAALAAWDR
jgi:hypothetical protein